MAKKRETAFKERVQADLKTLPSTWFFKSQERTVRGIPDLIVCVHGFFIALELKVDDNAADALQEWTLNKIRQAGGMGVEVLPESWPTFFSVIKQLAHGRAQLRGIQHGDEAPRTH